MAEILRYAQDRFLTARNMNLFLTAKNSACARTGPSDGDSPCEGEGRGDRMKKKFKKVLDCALLVLVIALLLVAAYYLLLFAVYAANVVPE